MSEFRILVVCTGNVCRSPLAEQFLRSLLAGMDVRVGSAGTEALVGRPMDDRAASYAERFGGDPGSHRARQLTVEQIRDADLVLTAEREHRRRVVESLPRASHFTFTLREFARLPATLNIDDEAEIAAGDDAGARASTLIAIMASNRGVAELLENPDDDDVVDPFRQSDEVYEESARVILEAVQSAATAVRRAMSAPVPH
ncbi:low molecular weight phosphatase family protein [Humibacter antri]